METLELINKPFKEINFNKKFNFHYDISSIIIPFSKIFKNKKELDVYSGNENIPFKERNPIFKMILQEEFSKF